jgi:hypothetical protein
MHFPSQVKAFEEYDKKKSPISKRKSPVLTEKEEQQEGPEIIFMEIDDENEKDPIQQVAPTKKLKLKKPPKTTTEIEQGLQNLSKEELIKDLAKLKAQQQSNVYDADCKAKDSSKLRANQIFLQHVPQPDDATSLALILDTSCFLTRDNLMKKGFHRDSIYIPQYDKEEYKKMREHHARVFHKSLYAFLEESEDTKFSATWFDYTCTLTGNDSCRPLDDIKLFFRRKFAKHNSLFAVTFSKRNVQMEEDRDVVFETQKTLETIAATYGYSLSCNYGHEYGNMYYLHFWVSENNK